MTEKQSVYRGCLLGMAVGDAMGRTVDQKSWEEICRDYGPSGLMGYDLANDTAEITSHTQIAAYVACGLLVGITRGKPEAYARFGELALREWLKRQHFPRDPEPSRFWISQLPQMRRRQCRDARMMDALRMDTLGTPESPINRSSAPGALTVGIAVGLFFEQRRLSPHQVGALAAELIAKTHGSPEAFLSGAVLAYLIAGIQQDPTCPLREQVQQALDAVRMQFGDRYSTEAVIQPVKSALTMSASDTVEPLLAMESLECYSAGACLAGAIYAALKYEQDFDSGVVCAVNHSGASAVVGAVAGAILGARIGVDALPDFYLESLDAVEPLTELADDLSRGSITTNLFDTDWDQKYVQGAPLRPHEE